MKFLDSRIVDAFLTIVPESQFFTVNFIKADDSTRRMVCKRGVTKHLKGGESTIADKENLVGVYEVNNDYRCFDKNRVLSLHGGGMLVEMRGTVE